MKADNINYDSKKQRLIASGNVSIMSDGYILNSDRIFYDIEQDKVIADGAIKITDPQGKIIYGEKAVFTDKLKYGIIRGFIVKLDDKTVIASKIAKRLDKNNFALEKTAYTPCETYCNNNPIWQIKSAKTHIDYTNQKVIYRHVFFEVFGVRIIYSPYFSHPTPAADAKSGLLGPSIKKDDFLIPFYFRAAPNFDFTVSPRLSKEYTIFEGELRHRLNHGSYNIVGSYGNPAHTKTDNERVLKNSRPERYHIFAKGDFNRNNINWGFDINRTSDKAYLANYHDIFNSHLTSKIYINSINQRDYFSLQSFYFQGLRTEDSIFRAPLVFPYIQTNNSFLLNEDESLLFNIRNNTITYNEPGNFQMARTAFEFELVKNQIFDNGHMITWDASNRSDLYWLQRNNAKTLSRNIPELSVKWRYPLIKPLTQKTTIKIEPTVMVVWGKNARARDNFNKFTSIDSNKIELSENNIFRPNKFSGIDYHEFGKRVSYGLNSTIMSDILYIDTFLGQLIHKNNNSQLHNGEYVGNISASILNNSELFFRFRRNKELKPIRSELGGSLTTDNLIGALSLTELNNITKYFAKDNFIIDKNKITQLSFNAKYRIAKDLWIGGGADLDISSSNTKVLVRTIQVTYLFDCVSVAGKLTDNFLDDSIRGVKKNRAKTFSIGLKTLNM